MFAGVNVEGAFIGDDSVATVPFNLAAPGDGSDRNRDELGAFVLMEIDINLISVEACQSREKIDPATEQRYVDVLKSGGELPPIDVFSDPETGAIYIGDGIHRRNAHKIVKRKSIKCKVRTGTHRDAVLFSFQANASHGLQRTNADVRRAILRMLHDHEWTKWTDKRIAESCRCTREMVSKIRREVGLDTPGDGPRVRLAMTPSGEEREIVVVGKNRKVAKKDDSLPLLNGVSPQMKTADSPLFRFRKKLDQRGETYEVNYPTPLGPIPILSETARTLYWVESALTPSNVCEATSRLLVLRSVLKNKAYAVTLVGDPDLEARAFINKLMELSGIKFEQL